jgi:hypothetical protein
VDVGVAVGCRVGVVVAVAPAVAVVVGVDVGARVAVADGPVRTVEDAPGVSVAEAGGEATTGPVKL